MPPPPPQPTQTSKLVLSRSLCEDCEVEANRTETVTCTLSHCHPPIDSHHDIGFYIIRRAQSLFPVHDQATDPYLGPINMSHVMHHGNNMCSRTLSFNTSEQIDGLGIQCHSHGHNGVKTSNAYIIAVHVHVQSTEAPSTIPTACPTPGTSTVVYTMIHYLFGVYLYMHMNVSSLKKRSIINLYVSRVLIVSIYIIIYVLLTDISFISAYKPSFLTRLT